MGSTQPWGRRALALFAAPALVSAALAIVPSGTAFADPANPTPVSSSALPTAQVDGVVWTQAVSNGIDYVGGSFTQSQPAGAGAGVDVTPRANLFAYDVSTGVAVPGFGAVTNGQVRGIAASTDGSRLYIVGNFTTVNGAPRNRIAAISATTGDLVPDFAPNLNASAVAIAVTPSKVYVGGSFTSVSGAPRSRVAAFTTSGALLPWAPQPADGSVGSIVISPDASKAVIAGSFTSTNGQTSPGRGMAAVDTDTGASLPWATSAVIHDGGVVNDAAAPSTASSSIYSLSTRGDTVYATGQATGTDWSDANLEGMVAMRWSDGGLKWIEDCHGDTYSNVAFDDAVYVASHSHNCSTVGGFGEMSPAAQRATGFSQATTQVLQHNQVQGPGSYQDFGGMPAPSLLNWFPTLTTGTFTGADQAAWSVSQGDGYLVYGGEFPKVNGVRQTGLVRFKGYVDPATTVSDAPAPVPTTTPAPTPTPSDSATPTASPAPTDSSTPTPTSSSAPTSTATPAPSDSPAPTSTAAPAPSAPGAPAEGSPRRTAAPDTVALGPSKVAVRWSAPKGASADKVNGYVIEVLKGTKVQKRITVGRSVRTAIVSGLTRSTTYRVGVSAKNAHGTATRSALDSVRTKAKGANVSATKKPSKVRTPSTSAGSGRVTVRWKSASTTGALGVQHYEVRVVLHGATVKTVVVDDALRSKLIASLKHRTAYTVSVRASNWAGWGSWSAGKAVRTR